MQSYTECEDYLRELSVKKVQQLESGETAEKGTMDLLGRCKQCDFRLSPNINRPSCQSFREQT
jgi:hypothetical protein